MFCAMAKPPRGGQIKPCRSTSQLQKNGGESTRPGGFLGNPEGVFKPGGMGQEQVFGGECKKMLKPQCMGEAGFEEGFIKPHP